MSPAPNKTTKSLSPLERKLNDWFARLSFISFSQKIFFVDHLKTMIGAGLSLVESLDILEKETSNLKFKKIIGEIKNEVEKGNPFSEILSRHPKVFPAIYVKMIASGEVSGKLEESLEQTVNQMKRSHELASSVSGAMIYPGVILSAMIGIGILMSTVVLPKILELFKEFDAELPLATRILIAIIDFVSNPLYFTLMAAAVIGSIIAFIFLLKRSVEFKRLIHAIYLRLPIIGPVIKKINLAKFSLTLSSLLKSTIPIIEAMDIAADTCANIHYRESLHETAVQIKSGEAVSSILRQYQRYFPPMVTEMIMVGERTGQIDKMLNELADHYGKEINQTMKNFSTIIEPVIILLLGVAVAGIAVAVVMPMFSLAQNF